MPEAMQLRPYQQSAIDAVHACIRDGAKSMVLALPTGAGKCLGLGTPVLKYDGSILAVEDVLPGHLLMGPDSRPRVVLSTTSGRGPLYRIVPVKGAPWVCNDVHVLTLVHTESGEIVDIPLNEYLAKSRWWKHCHKMFAPEQPVEFSAVTAPTVSPYFVGIWIGDGTHNLHGVAISKPDVEIELAVRDEAARWELEVRVDGPPQRCPSYHVHGVRGKGNPLLAEMRRLFGDSMAIPREYLTGTVAVRQELLAGIIDTDGYVHNGSCEVTQRRNELAHDIAFLARSLGFRVLISEKVVNDTPYVRLSISGDLETLPMRIPRKQSPTRRQKKVATRTGFTVESIGDGEYAGFELDGDGRFLLGDFTVTHNTAIACHLMRDFPKPIVFMCHRDELVNQTWDQVNLWLPNATRAICKAERGRDVTELIGRDVIIASAQTLAREHRLDVLKRAVGNPPLMFVDECFPAGTLVDDVPIERVRAGDTVAAFDPATGEIVHRRVVRVFKRRPIGALCRIMVGTSTVTATVNHPFWTRRGWVPAGELLTTDEVLHVSMQNLRGTLPRATPTAAADCNLFSPVPGNTAIAHHVRDEPTARFGQDGHAQSDAPRRERREDGGDIAGDGAQTSGSRREREAIAAGSSGTRGASGVADRGIDRSERWGAPVPLQGGHGGHRNQDHRRSGRSVARIASQEDSRYAPKYATRFERVDHVEVHEPTGDGTYGGLCPDGFVYNFEVEGLHTYTANRFVVHNCHHSAAETWRRTVDVLAPEILIGLTATPKRGDGRGMDDIFQTIAYSVPMSALVDLGQLARPIGLRIGTSVDLSGVATRQGDFAQGELTTIVNTPERNQLVVDAYIKHAADRKATIAFCVDIAHVEALTDTFLENGVLAEPIVGTTPTDERRAIYDRHRRGETPVIVSCMVLTEGFDQPVADCALMCRPTQSQSLYIQMAGRVLRYAPNKPNALIIDFVDVTRRHSLATILSLKGDDDPDIPSPEDDEEFDLFGAVKDEAERKARIKRASELLGDLLTTAQHHWITMEDGTTFAPTGEGAWLAVIRDTEGYVPVQVFKGAMGRSARLVRLFDRPADPQTAMEIATNLIPANKLTDPKAGWRDGPASTAQMDFARKLRIRPPEGITKGGLSELIDREIFKRALTEAR